jgi:6-pyruvoyltetrahydropterin/6-carboxytetrahydropterin synthase
LYRLTVRDHFDAAHFLRAYPGKCSQLHGHRWVVEVTVKGKDLDELGMLVDFSTVKRSLKDILEELDHRLINDLVEFTTLNPTAENLAKYLFDYMRKTFFEVALDKVRVYETPDAWAEYEED